MGGIYPGYNLSKEFFHGTNTPLFSMIFPANDYVSNSWQLKSSPHVPASNPNKNPLSSRPLE
jgi:hypothetical protein